MKFVHMADMHFDAPFTLLSDKNNFGDLRRLDQRKAFKKIIEYIKNNNIEYLFISGDLYEHQYIRNTTIEYINNLFGEIPNTKIFISPGNHDPYINNSMYKTINWNKNVKIFSEEIEKCTYGDINIYGFGFNDFYQKNSDIEEIKIDEPDKINILITHASLDGNYDNYREYNPLSEKKLKNIGFDYIALGHVHKRYISEDKKIVYPGSTISLGFDEIGQHGIIVGEIKNKKIDLDFIPIDDKEFVVEDLDITNIISKEELIEKINNIELENNKLYEINMVGRRNFEINKYEINKFILKTNIIKLKDSTKANVDIEKLVNENTLRGLFVKELIEKINSEENKENKKILEDALEIGLEILDK